MILIGAQVKAASAADARIFLTGRELVEDYLPPLTALPELAATLRLNMQGARVPLQRLLVAVNSHDGNQIRRREETARR